MFEINKNYQSDISISIFFLFINGTKIHHMKSQNFRIIHIICLIYDLFTNLYRFIDPINSILKQSRTKMQAEYLYNQNNLKYVSTFKRLITLYKKVTIQLNFQQSTLIILMFLSYYVGLSNIKVCFPINEKLKQNCSDKMDNFIHRQRLIYIQYSCITIPKYNKILDSTYSEVELFLFVGLYINKMLQEDSTKAQYYNQFINNLRLCQFHFFSVSHPYYCVFYQDYYIIQQNGQDRNTIQIFNLIDFFLFQFK
ncbi:unnamed protein product [Paramecium sonneborni]|uniref:Uncharacterized protein n=1 Tax=Paramecium sonneborni TaxID=65129 RepID=A0A8S1L4R8_9CILI|nr:unnamed protein product [Paramecium sonneborni]